MKILKEPSKFAPMELTCGHCKAVLLADRVEDFERNSYSDFRESWDYAQTECPCCGGGIQVSKDRFPAHIYDGLKRSK